MSEHREFFNRCIQEHADGLFRYARRMTNCDVLAQDMVQEAFVEAWNAVERLTQASNARAWLFTVLRRKIFRSWENQKWQPESLVQQEAIPGEVDPEQQQVEVDDWLQFHVMQMPVDWREPLLLVVMEQYTHQEAADILEIPVGTVLSRVHRARAFLKQRLEQTEFHSEEPRFPECR